MKLLLALICLFFGTVEPASAAELHARMQTVDLGILETGRPAAVNLWYPEGVCSDARRFCLADSAITNKVVALSHGSMGSAMNYSWLGESLAGAGFIVVGVNHYGESSVYGADSRDERTSAFIWQRPQDISALLTRIAGEKLFQRVVNWDDVVAIGHSAGGQTAALLAGARYDLRRLASHCEAEAGKADLSCNYGLGAGRAPDSFVAMFDASYQDTRVKKIVLMDPALGSALREDSLRAIMFPTMFIGARHSEILPWDSHGARYVSSLPASKNIVLEGLEGHFIFLTPCTYAVKVFGIALCEDRPGVDRAAVQVNLASAILDFVRADDEPATVARLPGTTSQLRIPTNPLLQILYFTPRWVFGLLASLIVLGLLQARTRRVPVWLALLLPVAMLGFSLSGVLQYAGAWWPACAAWVLGVGALAALGHKASGTDTAIYDSANRKLTIAASWVPLIVILTTFFVRYGIGVATARGLPIVQSPYLLIATGLSLGALSGYFAARGLLYWRAFAAGRAVGVR